VKISEADPKLSLAARLQNSFMSSSVFYPVYTYDSAYRFDKELRKSARSLKVPSGQIRSA
jgi:hypothetical protein